MSKVATADMENVRMIFESLDCLVRILYRCDIYEKLYTNRGLQATEQLSSTLVNLYAAVLEYLCYARRDLSKDSTGNLGIRRATRVPETNYPPSSNSRESLVRHRGFVQ